MDDGERLKAMKRLYYYKRQAIKKHNMEEAHAIELQLDELRIQKKDDPVYAKRMAERKQRLKRRNYIRRIHTGYYKRHSAKYRHNHPVRARASSHKSYYKMKSNPERNRKYLDRREKYLKRYIAKHPQAWHRKRHEEYVRKYRKLKNDPKLYQAHLKRRRMYAQRRRKRLSSKH